MSRTLVVTNDFPTRRGGIESFVLSLCERMPADEVVVYTASMPGDRDYDATLPFPVHRDPSGTLLPTRAVARRVIEATPEPSEDIGDTPKPRKAQGKAKRDVGQIVGRDDEAPNS